MFSENKLESLCKSGQLLCCTVQYCCDRKSRAACAQSFALWQQATIEIMHSNLSYYCLLAPHIHIFVLRAHPVRGESHNQCNTTREVATTSIGVAGGTKGPHTSPYFQKKKSFCALRVVFPNKIPSVIRLKSTVLPPPNFWADYATDNIPSFSQRTALIARSLREG